MSFSNGLGLASLAFLAVYALGGHLPASTVTANLRGISLLLILPLSLVAGWKGSRLWWLLSAAVLAFAIMYVVALGEHR